MPYAAHRRVHKKLGRFSVKNRPRLTYSIRLAPDWRRYSAYCRSFRSACGSALACASAATEDCCNTCDLGQRRGFLSHVGVANVRFRCRLVGDLRIRQTDRVGQIVFAVADRALHQAERLDRGRDVRDRRLRCGRRIRPSVGLIPDRSCPPVGGAAQIDGDLRVGLRIAAADEHRTVDTL